MEYLTTTNLRTKTSQLVKALEKGESVSLIHRSKVVGVINSVQLKEAPPIKVEEFRKFLESIRPKKIILRDEREKIYKAHLEEKYGKRVH